MRMESKEALDIIRERIDLAEREYAEQVPEYIEALKLSAELLQADAEGRLVVLPCKVGDTLYHIFYGEIIDTKVRTFFIGHPSYNVEKRNLRMIRTDRWDIPMDSIGKTVFLTRKEAEAALEKMGERK